MVARTHDYKTAFLRLALHHGVLTFGEFKLKSGRISPYFFNLGRISRGAALRDLGRAYARALTASGLEYDMLFGPAYKGIPLVAAVSIALAEDGRDVPYVYNRKETKDHGEGGRLVGAVPKGRVVIVDDVLTAGTALREAVTLLRAAGAMPVAALIALDRQEAGPDGVSARVAMERELGLQIVALIRVQDVLDFLTQQHEEIPAVEAIRTYLARHGA
ncbi:MAG: orotate phosphoribosyltransferase [Nevskiales bacterium]|nr:orotate phosphoribosyltransferase [Nevskiales bacterium]